MSKQSSSKKQTPKTTSQSSLENTKYPVTVDQVAALQRISVSVNTSLDQLNLNYTHARRQADQWSKVSIVTASLGFLVLLAGIILLLAGQVTTGVITTALGATTEGATLLLFRQSNEANKRVDENQRNLEKVQKIHDAITLWERMEPSKSRDKLMDSIVQQAFITENVNIIDEKSMENPESSIGNKKGIEGTVTITNSKLDGVSGDISGVKISGDERGEE